MKKALVLIICSIIGAPLFAQSIVQQPNSTTGHNFLNCSAGCAANTTLTLNATTTAGNLNVAVIASDQPITNVQGGGGWYMMFNFFNGGVGFVVNSEASTWVYVVFQLNAPSQSSIQIRAPATFHGAVGFYELAGVNAVDGRGSPPCVKFLQSSLGTTSSASISCTTGGSSGIAIGVLTAAPNTPTLTGTLTQNATESSSKTIFASKLTSASSSQSIGGTWASGSSRPTAILGAFYENTPPTAVMPILNPGQGTYGGTQSVSMVCANLGAVCHYTTNGTTPTCASTTYSGPITVSTSQTIEAISCVPGYNNSGVRAENYIITGSTAMQTWFVTTGGGGIFSTARATTGGSSGPFTGQAIGCDGLSSANYPGSGTNQHCALSDWRYLFDDQTFNNTRPNTWVPQGGDTIIISGCAFNSTQASNISPICRAGWDNNTGLGFGQTWCYGGGVWGCENPPIPSGVAIGIPTGCSISGGIATITVTNSLSAGNVVMPDYFTSAACKPLNGQPLIVTNTGLSGSQFQALITAPNASATDAATLYRPTRILGVNVGNCTANSGKQELVGSYGLGAAIDLTGAKHVDVECFNITRLSNCIQFGSTPATCGSFSPAADFDSDGIRTANDTSGVFLQDIWSHGHPARGVKGPIGGVLTCNRCNIDTNGSAGWDFDDGRGTAPDGFGNINANGTASINGLWNFTNSTIQWSGCNQEFPLVDPIPVMNCYTQSSGGYGDAVGSPPGQAVGTNWNQDFCLFNMQDCLDFGHNDAGPSGFGYIDQSPASYLVQNSFCYANLGGCWKSGPNTSPAVIRNTIVIGNCSRTSAPITGVPSGYNANIIDFCRSGSNISLNFHGGGTITMTNNTFVTYFGDGFLVSPWEGDFNDPETTLNFQNNITYGLMNAVPNATFPSGQDYGGNNGGIDGWEFGAEGTHNSAIAVTNYNRGFNQWFGVRSEVCASGFPGEICTDPKFVNEPASCLVSGGSGCTFTESTWDVFYYTVAPKPSFNLTPISPAIGAGTASAVSLPSTDFRGISTTTPPVIGALNLSGNIWYVTTSGSDSNPCTITLPCATPDHAFNTVAQPGDTVQVGAGTYTYGAVEVHFNTSGTSGNPITVTCATRGACKIQNSITGNSTVIWIAGNWVVFDGFEITNTSGNNNLGFFIEGHNVSITRNIVHGINADCTSNGGAGIGFQPSATGGVADSNLVYDIGFENPACHGANTVHGIDYETNATPGTYTITNNIIYHVNGGWGIQIQAAASGTTQSVVSNNLIFSGGNGGIVISQAFSGVTDFNVVTNNTIVDNGIWQSKCGISEFLVTGTHNVYQNNNVFGNAGGNYCFTTGSQTGGISVDPALGTTFINWQADGTGDYHEKSGSPTIGAAVSTGAPNHDYDGNPRPSGAGFDIGTFQFLGSGGTVATPTASPVAGTYTSTQSVTLSTTGGATICYTSDGSTPAAATAGTCSHGTTYSTAITVAATTTIKALGTLSGNTNSSVASFTYTITPPAATPTCTPAAGTYTSTQSITCSSTTPSSTTFCTTNGSTPTTSSPVCTSITVASNLTLKAISAASGFANSAVLTQNYTITSTVATPTAAPPVGTYTVAQSVVLSDATPGATICYTIDGTTPTATTPGTCTHGTNYSGAITVSTTTTIKALGTLSGDTNSAVSSFTYTITTAVNNMTVGGKAVFGGKSSPH